MTLCRRSWLRLLAALLGLAVIAAACGDDGGGGGGADNAGGGNGDGGGAGGDGEPVDEGTPVVGGKLIYGVEADTSTPWTPAKMVCASACHLIVKSVYDPLTLVDEDGVVHPNLAESVEPNADFTVWTITPRAGITFHDGEPFDAAAIVDNLKRHQVAFLTGKALLDVDTVEVSADGATAVVTMKRPWVSFDGYLAGQIGYMASPKWLAEADADPTKEAEPVGTGAFVFKSYEPGGSFIATRSDSYWKKLTLDGQEFELPFLDEVEFRVLVDIESRKNALRDGSVDVMHTETGDAIAELREDDAIEMTEIDEHVSTGYVLLNVGNPASELADQRVREALALGYNRDIVIAQREGGVPQGANGPFAPDTPGFLEDTGFPEFDLEAATALVDEYVADGNPQPEIDFLTTNDAFNVGTNELVASFWEQAGFKVTINQIEQGQYIIEALLGNFEAFAWRNHGGFDPDGQRVWWHSSTADDIGGFALNFGRIKDEVIDEQLDVIRETDDLEARTAAAEEINRRFGEQVYNLWSSWTVWAIPRRPEVNGVDLVAAIPSGEQAGWTSGVAHETSIVWLDEAA